jgi:hypothetical protein
MKNKKFFFGILLAFVALFGFFGFFFGSRFGF